MILLFDIPFPLVNIDSSLELLSRDSSQVVVKTTTSKIVIGLAPFRIDVLVDDTPVISVNARGLLKFEHLRVKK